MPRKRRPVEDPEVPALFKVPAQRSSRYRLSPTATKKRCSKCGVTKPVDAFYRKKASTDGRKSSCKACTREEAQERYEREGGIAGIRRANWARYGLTPECYERMFEEQGGGCATCGTPPAPGRALVVDHCHKTGKVRGLLCRGCNVALGGTRDRPSVLRRCADYLERHHGPDEVAA